MSTQELIAEIDRALTDCRLRLTARSDAGVLLRVSVVLSECRAALIARDGIWATYPAPYRDEEADVQPEDAELAARATSGKGWAH